MTYHGETPSERQHREKNEALGRSRHSIYDRDYMAKIHGTQTGTTRPEGIQRLNRVIADLTV